MLLLHNLNNSHYDDCKPRACSDCSKINVNKYEHERKVLTIGLNGLIYEVSGSFTKAGKYDIRVSALTMGLLKVTAYKSTDFTYQMFEQYINWVDIGLNSTFNPFLGTKTLYYSMIIQGFLTCLSSETYEIILLSNYRTVMYMDGIKYLSGGQTRFIKDLSKDKFYDIEIKIVVDERLPDLETNPPIVRLRWSTQNIPERSIKPRNFYYINPLQDNGSKVLTVQADVAAPLNSTITDTTINIIGTEYDEERRLTYKILNIGGTIEGKVFIYDFYGNLRGEQGEIADIVNARLYKDWVLNKTIALSQDGIGHWYAYSFTPSSPGYYQVRLWEVMLLYRWM